MNIVKLDNKFELILSIILAVTIAQIFQDFSSYETNFWLWAILSIIIFTLSCLVIYFLIQHKSPSGFSYFLKLVNTFLIIFFPYYTKKFSLIFPNNMLPLKIYILIISLTLFFWGLCDNIKEKKHWYDGVKISIGGTVFVLMLLSIILGVGL